MATVRLFATFRHAAEGRRELPLSAGEELRPLRDCLDELFARYPALADQMIDERGELLSHVSAFVNGRDVRHLEGLDTPVKPTDVLALFPPGAGG